MGGRGTPPGSMRPLPSSPSPTPSTSTSTTTTTPRASSLLPSSSPSPSPPAPAHASRTSQPDVPPLHPNLIYAVDNAKHRAFLPSTENYFGGIRIRYAMIDTGSNAHLLPIETPEAMDEIYTRLPPTEYDYDVGESKGVSSLGTLTLRVTTKDRKRPIEWRLCQDLNPIGFALNPQLRFFLCYDDAVRLMADHASRRVLADNVESIAKFIDHIDVLRRAYPTGRFGTRRTHALLGRDVLNTISNDMVVRGGLTMIGAYRDLVAFRAMGMTAAELREVELGLRSYAKGHMGAPDEDLFDHLEDEYGPDLPTLGYENWDE